MCDLKLYDKVRFQEPDGGIRYEGEVRGINHIHVFIRYGPGQNDIKFIPLKTMESFKLEKV